MEAERNDKEFEVPVVCTQCHLLNVLQVHANLVIVGPHVQLGEEPGATELIHHWDRELVLLHLVLQRPIVNEEALGPICLVDEQHQH